MIKSIRHKYLTKQEHFVKKTLPKYFCKSRLLSSLYFFLFESSFHREHQYVLAGKVKHLRDSEKLKANYFLLVRNTHRLEKGLLMRPKRAVYGRDYIKETIDSFEGVWNFKENNANPQLKWFTDVLYSYFEGAKDAKDPIVDKEAIRFHKIIGDAPVKESYVQEASIPYLRLDKNKSDISFDEFYKLTKQRRSVRWFLDKPVPRELIDRAILAANQSPSACNRQPFEFHIIDDPEMVKKVVTFPMGTTGYGHTIPVMAVLVGNLDAYFDERDRHVIYIDASLAAMSFMLALETLGLSSCAINWPDIEKREKMMEGFLKTKNYQRPIMCMGLGYADPEGLVAFSEKRPIDQIRKYNF